jgi:formylglycine-generating enzyme required for sulfatase activity
MLCIEYLSGLSMAKIERWLVGSYFVDLFGRDPGFKRVLTLKMVWIGMLGFGTTYFPSVAMPTDTFRDCADCPEMVVLPAGRFIIGSEAHSSESPPTPVTIPRAFAMVLM